MGRPRAIPIPSSVLEEARRRLAEGESVNKICRELSTPDMRLHSRRLYAALAEAGDVDPRFRGAPGPGAEAPAAPAAPPAIEGPPWLPRFFEALELSGLAELAAEYAGVTWGEFTAWLDAQGGPETMARLRSARGEATLRYAAVVARAALRGDVNAAKWMLERTRGDLFSGSSTVHHVGVRDADKPSGSKVVAQLLEQLQARGGPEVVLAAAAAERKAGE